MPLYRDYRRLSRRKFRIVKINSNYLIARQSREQRLACNNRWKKGGQKKGLNYRCSWLTKRKAIFSFFFFFLLLSLLLRILRCKGSCCCCLGSNCVYMYIYIYIELEIMRIMLVPHNFATIGQTPVFLN